MPDPKPDTSRDPVRPADAASLEQARGLMLQAVARFMAPDDPARPALRAHWLHGHPKSTLYVDFADFAFVSLTLTAALLNGGFGRACRIPPEIL